MQKDAAKAKKRAEKDKNMPKPAPPRRKKAEDMSLFAELDILSVDAYMAELSSNHGEVRTAIVNLPLTGKDPRKRANTLAKMI